MKHSLPLTPSVTDTLSLISQKLPMSFETDCDGGGCIYSVVKIPVGDKNQIVHIQNAACGGISVDWFEDNDGNLTYVNFGPFLDPDKAATFIALAVSPAS